MVGWYMRVDLPVTHVINTAYECHNIPRTVDKLLSINSFLCLGVSWWVRFGRHTYICPHAHPDQGHIGTRTHQGTNDHDTKEYYITALIGTKENNTVVL